MIEFVFEKVDNFKCFIPISAVYEENSPNWKCILVRIDIVIIEGINLIQDDVLSVILNDESLDNFFNLRGIFIKLEKMNVNAWKCLVTPAQIF